MAAYIKTSASKYKNFLALLLFVLLSIIAIGANPFTKETTGPFDLLVSYPGFSSVAYPNMEVRSRERSDILDARFPGLNKQKKEFYQGLRNISEKKFQIVEKLYSIIWKPSIFIYMVIPNDPVAFYLSQLIKLIIAGFGAYLFLKLFLSYPASLFGGMVYMLCGFNAAWFFWPQVDTSMWIPWVLWAVALYLIRNKNKYLFLITFVSVFLIKGAFPAVAAYGFYAAALLLFIYNIFNQKTVRLFFLRSFLPLLFIGFAFLISSDYLFKLIHITRTVDLSYRQAADTGIGLEKVRNLYDSSEVHVETAVYSGFLAFVFSLLSFLYLWTKEKSKRWKTFYLFSILLMVLSILITYSLMNPALIRKIPMFASHAWRRMTVMIGLSLSLLSSFFIEFFYKLNKKRSPVFRLVIPLLIVLFAVQFMDQKRYFNEYNGATPSKYFFPVTPSIQFVKDNIKDYQSIIADKSFNVSGTLSSYCFFEWYRHSFRSSEEKKFLTSLIPKSDISPTSFSISVRHIDFSSPLMNLFAVKYLLIDAQDRKFIELPHFFLQPGITHTPSPPLPFNELTQHFEVSQKRSLSGINLFIGNYRNENFDSDVRLELTDSLSQELLGMTVKEKRHIKDNTWIYFEFEKPILLEKGEYEFSIRLLNQKTRSMLSGWSTQRTEGVKSFLTVNGEKTDLSFRYSLHEATDIYHDDYRIHRLEPAVAVVENLNCPKGPYLISDIDEDPPNIINRSLPYESSVGEVRIRLPEGSSGYVVLPRPDHRYRAYVDGEKKSMERFLGVMPAVSVGNNSRVYFKEKPFYPAAGFMISVAGLLLFVILFIFRGIIRLK